MTTQNLSLFKGLEAKLHMLDQRQRLISQNIANADTPGYRPTDVKEADFGSLLGKIAGDTATLRPVSTNASHMPSVSEVANIKSGKQKIMYEIAPDGNSVSLEEQMVKGNQVAIDHSMMTMIYQKQVSMMRMAIGK